ncbi:hypothetical protein L7F22_009888 [Adiantum nelumboides]|nr:hypothetical protein [Adiantum nelumboides]
MAPTESSAKDPGRDGASTGLVKAEKRENGIGIVTINRPQALNALTKGMMIDLANFIKALDADSNVKVIILTGAGRAFCSGVERAHKFYEGMKPEEFSEMQKYISSRASTDKKPVSKL